jgi:putative hydrolase of the HAD superfamily
VTPPPLRLVETWVFDCDNTLYPPTACLFEQVVDKMRLFVMRELALDAAAADALRHRYFAEHGTTLAGLMANHALDPLPFLQEVHDIDLSHLLPDLDLAAAIAALPGRKIVYTNGSRLHAERICGALGLSDGFDAVYGIEDAGFAPKPRREAFERVFAADGLAPSTAAMVEDDQRNLEAPAAMGLATIWHPGDSLAEPAPHVHHVAHDLATFLRQLPETTERA